jgi:hypothetical protein
LVIQIRLERAEVSGFRAGGARRAGDALGSPCSWRRWGIYSVLSYTVGRRVQEIGVRMALGAQVRDVLRLVVVEGMRPTLLGIVLGLGAALALGRALASLFYGVSVADPILFGAMALLLAGVALLASAGRPGGRHGCRPARRFRSNGGRGHLGSRWHLRSLDVQPSGSQRPWRRAVVPARRNDPAMRVPGAVQGRGSLLRGRLDPQVTQPAPKYHSYDA